MDKEAETEVEAGFPGTWFIEDRSSQARGQPAERRAASFLRLLKTVSSTIAAKYPSRRVSGRILVGEPSGEEGAPSVSEIGDRKVEVVLEIPSGWLWEGPEAQSRYLFRMLSKEASRERLKDPGRPAREVPSPPGGRLVQFIHCASLLEPRERRFSSVPPAAFFMAPALRRRGFQVAVDSLVLEPFAAPGLCPVRVREESRERLDRIMERTPFCIALTAMDFYLEELRCLLQEIRRRDESVLIALGGPLVTLYPEKAPVYLPEGNVFIRGEADLAFGEVLAALAPLTAAGVLSEGEAHRFDEGDGLFLRLGETACVAGLDRQNRVDSLDDIFNERIDLGFIKREHVGNGLYLHTTRGCPYRCSFCSKVHGSRVRAMSSETILRILSAYQERICEIEKGEILSEQERQGAFQVSFSDDDFLLARPRAKDLLHRIRKTPFHLKTLPAGIPSFLTGGSKGPGDGRAFDTALFEAIEAAKDRILSFEIGTDDFTERELARLAKGQPGGYTLGEIEEVLRGLEQLRITNRHFVILSNPGTRWSDLFEKLITLEDWSWSYPHFYPDPNPFVLAPVGTPLYAELAGQGRSDALAKRVFTVPDFPEFTHWVYNMAPPRERLFSTDRLSTVGFFSRLCDLLKTRYRFSILDDAYLHFLEVGSQMDPTDGDLEEGERILDQLVRAVQLRRERIVSLVQALSSSLSSTAEPWRVNALAQMFFGMLLLRETVDAALPEGGQRVKREGLRRLLDEFSGQAEAWASQGDSLPAPLRDRVRQALAFAGEQVRDYRTEGCSNQTKPISKGFTKEIDRRLLDLGLHGEAEAWRDLCGRAGELVRLEVSDDRKDARFVEDAGKTKRLFEILELADPGLRGSDAGLGFLRAELVLRRSIREDVLVHSDKRVFVYDGLAGLPLGFLHRFQQEFDVSPFFDKEEFITALLSKFLVGRAMPHSRAMHGTFLFDGRERVLEQIVPRSLAEFTVWFFESA